MEKNNNQLPYVLNTPIESLIDNVRSWHEADQITGLEVRCERRADVCVALCTKNEYANLKWEFIAHREAALEIIQCDFHLLIFQ